MDTTGKSKDITSGICDLSISEHLHIGRITVEIQAVTPSLLTVGHYVDIVGEEEHFLLSVVPTAVGRKHIVLLPGVCSISESCEILVRLIIKSIGLDED